jgi:hypothetical protein
MPQTQISDVVVPAEFNGCKPLVWKLSALRCALMDSLNPCSALRQFTIKIVTPPLHHCCALLQVLRIGYMRL